MSELRGRAIRLAGSMGPGPVRSALLRVLAANKTAGWEEVRGLGRDKVWAYQVSNLVVALVEERADTYMEAIAYVEVSRNQSWQSFGSSGWNKPDKISARRKFVGNYTTVELAQKTALKAAQKTAPYWHQVLQTTPDSLFGKLYESLEKKHGFR